MPPKNSILVKSESNKEDNAMASPTPKPSAAKAGLTTSNGVVMPQSDVGFILDALQSTVGGTIPVDTAKVATLRKLQNPRSVSNRLIQLKAKYGIPFATATTHSAGKSGGAASNNPAGTPASSPTKRRAAPKTGSKRREAMMADSEEEGEEDKAPERVVKKEKASGDGGGAA